jgi:hypothetical protein
VLVQQPALALKGVSFSLLDGLTSCTAPLVNYVIKPLSSQAPEVLTRNNIPAYNIDEHDRRERLPIILEAYAQQFKNDFTHFLELRSKELLSGGRMVISITGRHSVGSASKLFHIWETIVQILCVMVLEVHLFAILILSCANEISK